MLRLLGEGKTLENLSQATGLSPATVTYYVNRLRQRNLVKGERQGHKVSYRVNAENTDALRCCRAWRRCTVNSECQLSLLPAPRPFKNWPASVFSNSSTPKAVY
jgi:predicted MarR family transcription regulator